MAHYVRTVVAGADARDPRSWRYAVYLCDACNEESEYKVVEGFIPRPRVCQHCHTMGLDDKASSLKAERADLIRKLANMNSRLLEIDTELSEIEGKQNVTEQIEEMTAK
jgi:hypothetical protein